MLDGLQLGGRRRTVYGGFSLPSFRPSQKEEKSRCFFCFFSSCERAALYRMGPHETDSVMGLHLDGAGWVPTSRLGAVTIEASDLYPVKTLVHHPEFAESSPTSSQGPSYFNQVR